MNPNPNRPSIGLTARTALGIGLLALACLAGCGGATDRGATPPPGERAAQAPAPVPPDPKTYPKLITELTDQTEVYQCPVCKMVFEGPGICTMKCAELVRTRVAYSCPADGKPVEHAGKCPRCDMDATVTMTAMTNETPAVLQGK